ALPMNDCRERHHRQIAQRDLQSAPSQPELGGGAHECFQTRSVRCGVTKLSDSGETDFLAEMTANHPEACRPAIHFVDLLNVLELADSLCSFSKVTVLICERCIFIFRFDPRLIAIEFGFVGPARLGRE